MREVRIDSSGEWLAGVRRVPSPNCDARPAGAVIDLIVIHGISVPPGCYGGDAIERLFTNRLDPGGRTDLADICFLRVSAHLLVRRDGECIQFVPFPLRAWHAGESCFAGRAACNDYSIGIELEGTDTEPYTDVQYRVLDAVCAALVQRFNGISAARIVGHCDVAPGRKTDPGPAFDWIRFRAGLEQTMRTRSARASSGVTA